MYSGAELFTAERFCAILFIENKNQNGEVYGMKKGGRITINDIAEMAGVSKTTISFYLNGKTDKMSEETKKKIGDIISETKYKPSIAARSLNDKKSNLIGVIIGDITNTFSNKIVKGIEETARSKGYQMLVGNSNYEYDMEESYVDKMLRLGVDGFIIQPTAHFKRLSGKINDTGKPLVFFDSKLYDYSTSWVKTDNYEATYKTIRRCIERGYEKFIMIGANPSLLSTRIERSSGFIDALEECGYDYENYEIEQDHIDKGKIVEYVKTQMDQNCPVLVFVPNCWALPEVFMALQEIKEQIPGHLGVIGFDNTEWTGFSNPSVTTIVQPAFEEGRQACKILIDQIEEWHEEEQHQILKCSVNWSQSTI